MRQERRKVRSVGAPSVTEVWMRVSGPQQLSVRFCQMSKGQKKVSDSKQMLRKGLNAARPPL